MKALSKLIMTATLSLVIITPSFAAIEIDEDDFGPSYGSMVADAVVGKPLGALAVAGGVAAAIISLPFTLNNNELDQVERKLILEPLAALDRCLGCTPAEDNYYRSQQGHGNQVRVVVDGPSEVLINTDQHVVVTTP